MDDNYYLVKEVSTLMNAHLLLIKGRDKDIYYLVTRNGDTPFTEIPEKEILEKIHAMQTTMSGDNYLGQPFPETLSAEIIQN
jgi:hypothetical protein